MESLHAILSTCCTYRIPIEITTPGGPWLHTRFSGLGREALRIDLPGEAPAEHWRAFGVCVGRFAYRLGSAVFQSRIDRIEEAHGEDLGRQLVLSWPQQLAFQDLRSAPRVRVSALDGVAARLLTAEGRSLDAAVRDLSTTGIGLELADADEARAIATGDALRLRLARGTWWADYPCVVRRIDGPRCALAFEATLHDAAASPDPALAALVGRIAAAQEPAAVGRPVVGGGASA